jgi:dUTP pyrophosphatase
MIPKYQSKNAADFDLHAVVNYDNPCYFKEKECLCILPKSQCIVHTGLAISIPNGFEIQIRPRSGLALKHSITITNSPGTIDSGFLDEIMIIVYNLGDECFYVATGDRIAQAVLNKIEQAEFEVVEDFDEKIKKDDRGGGLGSTGLK